LVFIAIFVLTYALILSEKINKTLAAIIGAIGIVATGSFLDVFSYETALEFIELEVLLILIGTFIITAVAEESNIFGYHRFKPLKKESILEKYHVFT